MTENSSVVLPYSYTQFNGKLYSYHYWSLKDSIIISSEYPFSAGDIVDVVAVDEEKRVVTVRPATNREAKRTLLILSNDIPLGGDSDYRFWFDGCEPLVQHESTNEGNKIYSFVVLVDSENASIKGYNRCLDTRIQFQIVDREKLNG